MLWTMLLLPSVASCFKVPSSQYSFSSPVSLKWEECGSLNNHTVECSRIDVPVDHFNEALPGKTFSLPLIRMLAKNASATEGKTILLNPGGPGGSGINFLWRTGEYLNKAVGEGFHLLSFDPRGVNGSIPQASCFDSPAQRAQDIETNPWDLDYQAGEMFTRAENKAKACTDTMGDIGAYLNTPQTAADMNTILDAIGQEQMYYWGFSYGTTLGQTYAQLFPERVAKLIIDGVSNLDEWYNSVYFDESLIDTDKVYTGFFQECFKAKERCPLNNVTDVPFKSASAMENYVDQFLQELEENPVPVYLNKSKYGSVTTRAIIGNGIFAALYKPAPRWPDLAKNLAGLLKGNATSSFLAYSDYWVSSIIGDETNTFVVMNDNWKTGPAAPFHGIKPVQKFALSLSRLSKLMSKYMGSDIFDHASWSILKTHDFHPRYYPGSDRVRTAEPILVISTTYDPVCPLISAKKAHNSFEGAGFIEQKSYGHCSISMPSLCTAKHVRNYLYDGKIPEKGTSCDIDDEYFPGSDSSFASSESKDLNAEDMELLAALKDLASANAVHDLPLRRRF